MHLLRVQPKVGNYINDYFSFLRLALLTVEMSTKPRDCRPRYIGYGVMQLQSF